MRKKREISSKELVRIYDKWLGNFSYGVTEILNLDLTHLNYQEVSPSLLTLVKSFRDMCS